MKSPGISIVIRCGMEYQPTFLPYSNGNRSYSDNSTIESDFYLTWWEANTKILAGQHPCLHVASKSGYVVLHRFNVNALTAVSFAHAHARKSRETFMFYLGALLLIGCEIPKHMASWLILYCFLQVAFFLGRDWCLPPFHLTKHDVQYF